ncbi:hypothetical protein OIU83_04595 [Flavobacterium sp. LS1R49]|uniref:Uncharacterized protein n=1 Tax=Flavobacterium shii TaxID=2987687 RepID=A0A9X2YU08_9FLAO|nr:hypothetical protein [Flavobacterium shii]MCV9926914.1 hypothetical protein [Flavobacterium shii]
MLMINVWLVLDLKIIGMVIMMRELLIIGLIFIVFSCKPQNKKQAEVEKVKHYQVEKNQEYNNLVTNDFETFDVKRFYKDNEVGIGKIHQLTNNIKIEESAGEKDSWFVKNESANNSLYSIYKEFYQSGRIKSKGSKFKEECPISIWYYFDEKGKLIKETDLDKPFKITIKDIIEFLKQNEADLFSNYTSINRSYDEVTKKRTWNLIYRGKYKDKQGMFSIEIDDSTAEIIEVVKILGKEGEKEMLFRKE